MYSIAISIIMPIYNASSFLDESLGGLLDQSFKNFEIVCVNDGSTDNSLDIINNYAQRDSRIKIIDKKNSGYGNTMNIGIEHARGEYIAILEPDDFMDTNMLEVLYKIMQMLLSLITLSMKVNRKRILFLKFYRGCHIMK